MVKDGQVGNDLLLEGQSARYAGEFALRQEAIVDPRRMGISPKDYRAVWRGSGRGSKTTTVVSFDRRFA